MSSGTHTQSLSVLPSRFSSVLNQPPRSLDALDGVKRSVSILICDVDESSLGEEVGENVSLIVRGGGVPVKTQTKRK